MKTKRILSLLIAFVLCFSSISALGADDVTKEYIVTTPSLQDENIDYSNMSNWAYWNLGEDKPADLFFVCPTVDMGKDGNLVSDINSEKYRESFVGAINMELGIYSEVASVYAPYYRQATFPVYSLSKEEQETYLSFAYADVKEAFIYYADNTDSTRPLILAGFSQGADLIIRLMKDLFDEPKYQRRLVAAYCIGWKLTSQELAEYPHLKPAQSETDNGVIVAFNSEDKDIASSLIIGKSEKTYSINPLNWKTTSEKADKTLNLGACFTDYSGNIKEEIPNLTGAYIDEKRGALKVTDIAKEDYPGKLFEDGIYHLYDYQFFFRNLQENVKTRLLEFNSKYADRINIYYNDDILCFDVEPIIENGRTLVPLRAIFEAMGCAVYYSNNDGKEIISARRANNNLNITVGENKMNFNDKEIHLDVPAKIKDDRTLVPIRAISEAFECEVQWYEDIKTIRIYSPAEYYAVTSQKLSKTITDDNDNILIEAVAYYPVLKNPTSVSYLDEINLNYKSDAEKFIAEAAESKADAEQLRLAMGESLFSPCVFEQTYEQTYNGLGALSFTNHKYINVGGIHSTTSMESRTYSVNQELELALSQIINEDSLDCSILEYVTNLFVKKLNEVDPQGASVYTHEYVLDLIGYVQFYITENSVVIYFNPGDIASYELGVITVEIPYDTQVFKFEVNSLS